MNTYSHKYYRTMVTCLTSKYNIVLLQSTRQKKDKVGSKTADRLDGVT